jgi:hypothetical protein
MPFAPGLARTADLFLAGYLRYLYGHGTASQVQDATPSLPRVLLLHSEPASSGLLGISAVVNDGGLVDYSIDLLITRRDGRLLVTGIEGGAG